jgi:tRNA-uridine 2-sulfurtransferase
VRTEGTPSVTQMTKTLITHNDPLTAARAPAAGSPALDDALPLLRDGLALAAMSGGVDSAVATALAVGAGRKAVGVTMRLWSPGQGELSEKVRQCCGPTAYEDARRAASLAGIAHYVVNFEAAFERAVVDYFCGEYLAGRTPNPCVACNNLVKFGALLDFSRALGARTMITGHYVRIRHDADGPHLLRAVDRGKDQSYMLAGLRPEQLGAIVAPLGDHTKEQTRALARELGLGVADKPDSMDLCFVDGDYRGFILARFPDAARSGPIVTTHGVEVGRHDGLLGYTVGQRKGISNAALGDGPWYVVRTERRSNAVVIGRREALARRVITCGAANVIRPRAFSDGRAAGRAVCRYRSAPIAATAQLDGDRLTVSLAQPASVVSPGQLLVLYDESDAEVLASGIIEPAEATEALAAS